ncbi:MAG: hypothetical protein IT219_07715 [Bacteroidales bacterium]|jgi:hypothetical protein|nr:hypothetical protein [Bacteroidales bacterium]
MMFKYFFGYVHRAKPASFWGWTALLFLMLVAPSLQSQDHTAFYFKNGEVTFGQIVGADSLGSYRVQNDCGIRLVDAKDLDSIQIIKKATTPQFFQHKKKGYYNLSSLALLFGEGRNDNFPVPSLTMVNGYYFNPQFFTGIGVGYEYYEWSTLPVFAEVKYVLKKHGLNPFASLKIGYGFSINKDDKTNTGGSNDIGKTYGGVLISPELGILIPVGKSDAFLMGIGYHHQELSKDSFLYGDWRVGAERMQRRVFTNYNRILLRISFMFR